MYKLSWGKEDRWAAVAQVRRPSGENHHAKCALDYPHNYIPIALWLVYSIWLLYRWWISQATEQPNNRTTKNSCISSEVGIILKEEKASLSSRVESSHVLSFNFKLQCLTTQTLLFLLFRSFRSFLLSKDVALFGHWMNGWAKEKLKNNWLTAHLARCYYR